jgi:DNA-binding NarL/FixJ family response regulator
MQVDDHLVFRERLAMVVTTQPDMRLVAEAANGREAFQQFRAHWPDLTLVGGNPWNDMT